MNYYIDFDNTLYNTPLLTQRILDSTISLIKEKNRNLDFNELYEECNSIFNRNNINEFAKFLFEKYSIDSSIILSKLNSIILNGCDLVFEDTIPFLKNLKQKGHNIFMLTHCKDTLEYQSLKIIGSKLTEYFDGIYLTCTPKYTLDINYTNGIFIDDNPDDLLGLYSKNAIQVIRLRRKENKYSLEDIHNDNIKEYLDFSEINII